MSLTDELVALFELHKSGGITDSEYQTLKTRMINENPREVAKILGSQKKGSNLTPLQIGSIAGASSIGTRLIMDHLKNDRKLQDQIEKLQTQVAHLDTSADITHLQVTEIDYQSTDIDPDFDFS